MVVAAVVEVAAATAVVVVVVEMEAAVAVIEVVLFQLLHFFKSRSAKSKTCR